MTHSGIPQSIRSCSFAVALVSLVVLGVLTFVTRAHAEDVLDVMCTADAKECPDGSFVGREGPNCEFVPCPGAESKTVRPQTPVAERNVVRESQVDRQARVAERREQVEARKALLVEKRGERKAALAERSQLRLQTRVQKMTQHLENIEARLREAHTRMLAHIAKVEENSVAQPVAREHLSDMQKHLDGLDADIASFTAIANAVLVSEDPRAAMSDVRAATELVKESASGARDSLRHAVESLRGAALIAQ